ncbi:hypothetical protein FRC04_010078 [Tulasnella sp. 424]|nr:hypothetical protein FRC04_010078 [Tulasnella sp. 424]KAG8974102.1 hypothetical protein FRC05_007850 [Tulasnella sp. 425]
MVQKQFAAGLVLGLASALVKATVPVYYQCGGITYTGDTACAAGTTCVYQNDYYSQCLPSTSSTTTTSTTKTSSSSTKTSSSSTKTSSTTTTSKSSTTTTTTTTTSSSSSASASSTVIPLRGLNTLAKAHGRYFGTALDGLWSNTDTTYLNLSGNFSEFGMVTPGNAMKWDTIEATQNVFSYTHGDYIVSFAHNHSQAVRGHTFVWYNQLPSWLSSGTWTNATLISVLQNHIANEAGHYKGQVYSWDVVNEIFNDDGTWRSTIWYNTIGTAFVPIAFNAAHAADTGAKLYLNDYNIEGTGSKADAYYTLAQSLLAQGVPVHGIGAQAHLIVGSLPGGLSSNIARFVALGLEWAYTELDIRMTLPSTDALLATQATNYASIATACVGNSGCVGITTWDTSDDYSWVPSTFSGQGAALLFDANKQPKPAYKAVADVLAAATISGTFTGWYKA